MSGIIAKIVGFFASSTIKYWLMGIGALTALGIIASMYFSITNMASENAKLTAEVAAKQIVIDEQNQTIAHQKALMKLQALGSQQLDLDINTLDKKEQSISDWIHSPDAMKSDRPSSLIIKETIEKLGK